MALLTLHLLYVYLAPQTFITNSVNGLTILSYAILYGYAYNASVFLAGSKKCKNDTFCTNSAIRFKDNR